MSNLLDYMDWRGDLTLEQTPFCEVDNLILAELSFLNFTGIVPGLGERQGITLAEAAEQFFERYPAGEKIDMGVLIPDEIPELLARMAVSNRFSGMRLSDFVDHLDVEKAEQFAALTVDTGDGMLYLAFRGTDDTLAGWKEDFMLAYMQEVPAQRKAVEYVTRVAQLHPRRKLRLGGHSKGGNLAIWAGVFVPANIQRRIIQVWSNDGPGFLADIRTLPEYRRLADRIVSIVPKSSVVGMLLNHEEDQIVVDSSQTGLLQHDGFSWLVMGNHFVRLSSLTRQSKLSDLALKEWVERMPMEQKVRFVDGLFEVLSASGAETLTDLKEDWLKSAAAMARAMKDMEKDTREALIYAVKLLFESNFRVLLDELQQEGEKKLRKKGS